MEIPKSRKQNNGPCVICGVKDPEIKYRKFTEDAKEKALWDHYMYHSTAVRLLFCYFMAFLILLINIFLDQEKSLLKTLALGELINCCR